MDSKNNLDILEDHLDILENHLDISENNLDISENEITCLCFSGGSIKAFTFIGVLKKLIECNKINLDKINMFVGTSAGTMISFFLILGFSIEEIEDFIPRAATRKKLFAKTVISYVNEKTGLDIDCIEFWHYSGSKNDVDQEDKYNFNVKKNKKIRT